jgi:hypothetical protein
VPGIRIRRGGKKNEISTMNSEPDGHEPATEAEEQSLSSSPSDSANKQTGAPGNPKQERNPDKSAADELAREFRWVEWASVIINTALAIIGGIALHVYSGQLDVMRGTLELMKVQTALGASGTQAAIVAANAAKDTLAQIQSQTTLLRQQVIASQTGPVNVRVEFQYDKYRNPAVLMALYPTATATMPWLTLNSDVRRFSFPDLTLIGGIEPHVEKWYQVKGGVEVFYPLRNFSSDDYVKFTAEKYTMKFSGSFSFDNGFGNEITQNFCFDWLGGYEWKGIGPWIGIAGTRTPGFVRCADFADEITTARKHFQ